MYIDDTVIMWTENTVMVWKEATGQQTLAQYYGRLTDRPQVKGSQIGFHDQILFNLCERLWSVDINVKR